MPAPGRGFPCHYQDLGLAGCNMLHITILQRFYSDFVEIANMQKHCLLFINKVCRKSRGIAPPPSAYVLAHRVLRTLTQQRQLRVVCVSRQAPRLPFESQLQFLAHVQRIVPLLLRPTLTSR